MKKLARLGSIVVLSIGMYAFLTRLSRFAMSAGFAGLISSCVFLFCAGLWCLEYRTAKCSIMANTAKRRSSSRFDWGMHYFRAFAILAIIACHYCALYGYKKLNLTIFTSSTIYFLFISGYLCQFLDDRRRESPWAYYRKKIANVICPFCLFSVFIALFNGDFSFSASFLKNMLLGRVQGQYWYIPFVALLFVFSPFICRMSNRSLVMLTSATGLLFILFPFRIGVYTIKWPEFFYLYTNFTFFYVFGFLYERYKDAFELLVKKNYHWFVVGSIFTALLVWNQGAIGVKYSSIGIVVNTQRFLTLFWVIGLLCLIREKKIWLLDSIAKFSFTLYFIHFGFLVQFKWLRLKLLDISPLPVFVSELLIYVLFLFSMLIVSFVLKAALGKYSRHFIGS